MVQEAEALEKPGKPTFFETPAWSFNMGWVFLELKCGVWKAELNSHPPSTKGRLDGGAEFIAAVKQPPI